MFTLERESVTEVSSIPNQQSWPLRINATYSDGGAPAKIFVYQTSASPLAGMDFFSCVAGASQMTELPEDSGEDGVPFFRVASMLAYCRSATHADEFWAKVQRAVQDLADNLALVDALEVTETVTITPNT